MPLRLSYTDKLFSKLYEEYKLRVPNSPEDFLGNYSYCLEKKTDKERNPAILFYLMNEISKTFRHVQSPDEIRPNEC